MPKPEWLPVASGGLRDRAEFVVDNRSGATLFGLFSTSQQDVLDLEVCVQLSPALTKFFSEIRNFLPDVNRGTIRLRVSPSGARGVWLDFANLDVKRLLEERTQLENLRKLAFVEIGQKRKALIDRDGVLKLGDPQLQPWFETYLGEEETPVEVFTTVGGFTQPGFQANRVLVRALRSMLKDISFSRAAEFGSGSGNLTFPLAQLAREKVDAYELDELAAEGLKMGAERAGLTEKISIHVGNFQLDKNTPEFIGTDLILVDPPRSGVMGFIQSLASIDLNQRPKHFAYVSCFAESFAKDASALVDLGYKPKHVSIVDQFPQSPHFEIVSLFSLS